MLYPKINRFASLFIIKTTSEFHYQVTEYTLEFYFMQAKNVPKSNANSGGFFLVICDQIAS
jgi:hypothetical protein